MFTQLFGNFLLRKGVVSPEQLLDVMKTASGSRVKLGTLCIHAGLMSAAEVEKVFILQTHVDKRFGEIAVEEGYLTDSQVNELMKDQGPNYLLLAQALVESKILTHEQIERLLSDYQAETKIFDLDMMDEQKEKIQKLVMNFCNFGDIPHSDRAVSYLHLLFNNLIRFIGDDFTPLSPIPIEEYLISCGSSQEIKGEYSLKSAIDMDEQIAIAFASRYAGETLTTYDEYVSASMDDFLNLHNGLFLVNVSNTEALELELCPPVNMMNEAYHTKGSSYLLPICYTFGTVNFVITLFE